MFTSKQIRSTFIDFFKDRGHTFIPSSPVVPMGDPTLLFANAGMNQFKDIFLGLKKPECPSAANSQKCIRVSGKHNDLEEVGVDTYHHTFFEMLGNWSFDSYFKEESIRWAWELVTEVFGIDPDKLWATVFVGDKEDGLEYDKEAHELWKKVTSIHPDRILACGKKDNFWEMGDSGPCGPCSEIHIDLGEGMCDMQHVPGHKCAVNAGCSRFIELWNLVFIQYNRLPDGSLHPLSAKYVDTGAGLERIAAVLQNKKSNYDTDVFSPIISAISDLSGVKYTSDLNSKTDIATRVIADHIRSLTFAITDGANPGNDGRGYVLRRILRRASRFGRVLDLTEPFMYKLVPMLSEAMGEAFPELPKRSDYVQTVIESEETSFGRTLDRGLEIFNSAADKSTDKKLAGEEAFQLYDTYGFPLDLTQLMARERGLEVDNDRFNELMEEQRARARAAQKTDSLASALIGAELPEVDDSIKYETDACISTLLGIVSDKGYQNSGEVSEDAGDIGLVIDKTCFYAESGGQVGDSGMIVASGAEFIVENTEKMGQCVIHKGKVAKGKFKVGSEIRATVDLDRDSSKKNHTATHILQWALQQVVGESVHQQGSLVSPDYLRFDFTSPKALSPQDIKHIEHMVQEKIDQAIAISCATMSIDQAKELGAMALFGEKYGSEVRVVGIGAEEADRLSDAFSREFCGGTHVENTAQIGGFKILKEESVSAGVRRITAVTGKGLMTYLSNRNEIVDEITELLKTPDSQILSRIEKLVADNKDLTKKLKDAHKSGGSSLMTEAKNILDNATEINGVKIIVGQLPEAEVAQLREVMDMLRKKGKSAVIFIGSASVDKVMLMAGVTDDVVKKGVKAGDLVKELAPIVGGGGGGRPQMAQAGGKDPAKLPECLEKAKELIASKLG